MSPGESGVQEGRLRGARPPRKQGVRGAFPPGREQGNKGDIFTGGPGGYTTHLDAQSSVF